MSKALVIYSGGLDSTVLLYKARQENEWVGALHFKYGQKHSDQELSRAHKICALSETPLYFVAVPFWEWGITSYLLSQAPPKPIPTGVYNEESMKDTVVPFRNGIMISIAAGIAASQGYERLYIGAHGGDHAIYPDCRVPFLRAMNNAVQCGTDHEVRLVWPFRELNKVDIVRLGTSLDAPMDMSYSCFPSRTGVLTPTGYRPIEMLSVGDVVITHLGRRKKVTAVFEREYCGEVYMVQPYTSHRKLFMTPEHPVLSEGRWVKAKELHPSDMIDDFIIQDEDADILFGGQKITARLALLLGYFAAEGHLTKPPQSYGIEFTFHSKEQAYIKEVVELLRTELAATNVRVRAHQTYASENVRVDDKALWLCFRDFFEGRLSMDRSFNKLLYLAPALQKEFLVGFYRGDGHWGKYTLTLGASTVNENLMWVVYEMWKRRGKRPAMYKKSPQSCSGVHPQWHVNVNGSEVEWLQEVCPGARPAERYKCGVKFATLAQRKIRLFGTLHYDGLVHNLEVEEDNSYIAENIPVHNCYNGGELHCGECATCLERRGAFKLAEVKDLTEYEK